MNATAPEPVPAAPVLPLLADDDGRLRRLEDDLFAAAGLVQILRYFRSHGVPPTPDVANRLDALLGPLGWELLHAAGQEPVLTVTDDPRTLLNGVTHAGALAQAR